MIGVLGTNHKCANLATREVIAKALASCSERLQENSVFLFTCNRAEWYFCTHTPSRTHQEMVAYLRDAAGNDAICHLYTFFGLECFRHLGTVVSGLDSVFVGETEIQGQVKTAYDSAREKNVLPKELHFLFQRALHTGKVVRGKIQLPEHHGLCEQVSTLVSTHMRRTHRRSVLLVGTSTVNRRLAHTLKNNALDITVANRTNEKASSLASEIGGKMIPWEELPQLWCQFPCVVAATRSEDYLLQPLQPLVPLTSQLLIDLGVPRNIDPALASPTRKIVDIEAFSPSKEIETVLSSRSWHDYLCLSQRT